jgi:hypothetical protein
MREPVVAIVVFAALLMSTNAQTDDSGPRQADRQAITETALDYGQGWYAGDADRMERALHPDLAKRVRWANPAYPKGRIQHMSAMKLVQSTRRGGGSDVPEATRRTDVKILDIYGTAASVRLDMHDWIDYLHMSKIGERWVIVNVLWELTPAAKKEDGFPTEP